jgi:hypothetical protein
MSKTADDYQNLLPCRVPADEFVHILKSFSTGTDKYFVYKDRLYLFTGRFRKTAKSDY